MAKFPALPATVDRYVREFLNRLAGRSGNAGDKAVLHSERKIGKERLPVGPLITSMISGENSARLWMSH